VCQAHATLRFGLKGTRKLCTTCMVESNYNIDLVLDFPPLLPAAEMR
jgi:hypothetical protein